MQPTTGGGGGGIGLSRFRSAPATWLEALLESEEEDVIIDPPKPPLTPPPHTHPFHQQQQHSTTGPTSRPPPATYVDPSSTMLLPPTSGLSVANRQNSLPAEFFSQINAPGDGSFVSGYSNSGYDDYISPSGLNDQRAKFTTQLSGDQSALLDAEMDKLLGESVPCRVRAKRGCATHPRSIAERVRRTRISDRIRKLQDLVPNMDKGGVFWCHGQKWYHGQKVLKWHHPTTPTVSSALGASYLEGGLMRNAVMMQQTNTADMLEEAVEYVKFLQRQIQELREHRDKCTCLVKV